MTVDSKEEVIVVKLKRRPSDSAFKQQRLPEFQPVLKAGTVLPAFFIIGTVFIAVGIALLYISDSVHEHIIDYTDCNSLSNVTCASILTNHSTGTCSCSIPFTLEEDFQGTVYLYYGLKNYYQNNRHYVDSRDDYQLLSDFSFPACKYCTTFCQDSNHKRIVPCGAIANSLFNDTLRIRWNDREGEPYVPLLNTGIAWPLDKARKFRNPPGDLKEALKNYVRPIAWTRNLWELDPDNPDNNGLQNEDLIVWMHTASLPDFRKLYRRIDHSQEYYRHGLWHGNYTLEIDYRYPVSLFHGRKEMVLSTMMLGGKNPFLGFVYIVVGCVGLVLGVMLLFIHIKYGNK